MYYSETVSEDAKSESVPSRQQRGEYRILEFVEEIKNKRKKITASLPHIIGISRKTEMSRSPEWRVEILTRCYWRLYAPVCTIVQRNKEAD